MGITDFFADMEGGETNAILLLQSNTDNNDAVSLVNSPIEPFNNDKDFANFQLGEFGVTQSNHVFHLTRTEISVFPSSWIIVSFISPDNKIFTILPIVYKEKMSFIRDMSRLIMIKKIINNFIF